MKTCCPFCAIAADAAAGAPQFAVAEPVVFTAMLGTTLSAGLPELVTVADTVLVCPAPVPVLAAATPENASATPLTWMLSAS